MRVRFPRRGILGERRYANGGRDGVILRPSATSAAVGPVVMDRCIYFDALLIAMDVATDIAVYRHPMSADATLVEQHFSGLMKGALFALWGNHLPKLMSPWPLEREPFDWQGVNRFVGRVAVAAGLGMVAAWSTFPIIHAERAA